MDCCLAGGLGDVQVLTLCFGGYLILTHRGKMHIFLTENHRMKSLAQKTEVLSASLPGKPWFLWWVPLSVICLLKMLKIKRRSPKKFGEVLCSVFVWQGS